jgi:hypothetical protein
MEYGERPVLLSGDYRFVDGEFSGMSGDLSREELGLVYIDRMTHDRFTLLVEHSSISAKSYRSRCPKARQETTTNARFFCFDGGVGALIRDRLSYGVLVPPTIQNGEGRLAFASMVLSSLQ